MAKKHKTEQIEQFLSDVLNLEKDDIIIVREKNCELLFANPSAVVRMQQTQNQASKCSGGYKNIFPGLCNHCPAEKMDNPQYPYTFDTKDKNGELFTVFCNQIKWLDGKPAILFRLRNVSEERGLQQKLYNLAYLDHLTGVPNRQKFKEDFDAIAQDIEDNKLRGIVSIFDLDNFKTINDTYGHNTGDVMLKRLTMYFEGDPAFKDHIYRLGGDEFVLFYSAPIERFPTLETCQAHFESLLKSALHSYTMPNIDLSCTISMGVAIFPEHGDNTSELLRKSDIALYKAKAAGRNRMVFFEDRYDKAKKFKDLYISIQPILSPSSTTFGYELVDRGNENLQQSQSLNLFDADRTMDALNLGDFASNACYFISYSKQLHNSTVLKNLHKNKFIIQIQLTTPPTQKELDNYAMLQSHGYSLALSCLHRLNANPKLLECVQYCKFSASDSDISWQNAFMKNHPDIKFIATQIDTVTDLEIAKQRGFELFQGFYFNEPVVEQKTKDISPLKANYLRLLQLTSTDDYVNFQDISEIIASDVALSYKLLRLLNSAAVGLRNQISSIDMAVAYLGEEHLKQWIALLALRGIADGKPLELIRISLIRARFAELLAPHFRPVRNSKHVFLIGLFSLLHIALEKSKEELFEEIPVADDIKNSLLTKDGIHSDLTAFFSNYEYANWEEVIRFAEENQLSDTLISDAYVEAVRWYNKLTE